MPLASRLSAVLLLTLAACDSQAPPPRTNPLDPGFEGSAVATAPADLALAEATPTSATLSWTDRSSFETGVRVERLGRFDVYETLAVLPPDATRYTDTGLTGAEPRTYRVVALAAGGTESAPSAPFRIRYPADTLDLGPLDLYLSRISPDGERLFTRDGSGTRITSLRTGASLGTIPRTPDNIIGVLADGRIAFRELTPQPFTTGVRLFDGPAQGTLTTLRFPENACFGIGESRSVSADFRRIADLCGDAALVWTLPSDVPARYFLPFNQPRRVTITPDGSRIIAEGGSRFIVLDAATGAVAWEAPNVQETWFGTLSGFSPDGAVLAYAAGGRIRIVDPATGAVRVEAASANRTEAVAAASATEILVTGYDETLGTATARVLRVSDLSLVRTLPGNPPPSGHLVPGAVVTVGQTGGRTVAVRQSFTAVWEAAGR